MSAAERLMHCPGRGYVLCALCARQREAPPSIEPPLRMVAAIGDPRIAITVIAVRCEGFAP